MRVAWSAVQRSGFSLDEKTGDWMKKAETFKPTEAMARNARRALEVRESKPESQRGMTSVGLARANQLIGREPLSLETVQRMASYFARHEVDRKGSTWDEQGKGWQAWQAWGGDEGRAWAESILSSVEKAEPPPNLRDSAGEKSCSVCKAFQGGTCKAYSLKVDASKICDSFSVEKEASKRLIEIQKMDQDQQLVFGWLYVANDTMGNQVVDHSGETIAPAELEKAAYDFVLKSRVAGRMHEKIGVGRLVESVVFTSEKRQAMGIPDGVVPDGIWVGFKIDDSETWSLVKSGQLPMLSLGGKANRRKVGELE